MRNDCTNIQQHVLTKRIINMRKKKEIQIIAKGRGRLMLAAQFPELPLLLEYAFGDTILIYAVEVALRVIQD